MCGRIYIKQNLLCDVTLYKIVCCLVLICVSNGRYAKDLVATISYLRKERFISWIEFIKKYYLLSGTVTILLD